MPATPSSPPKRMTRARAKAVEEKKKLSTKSTATTSRTATSTAASRARAKVVPADASPANDSSKAKPAEPKRAVRQTAPEPPKTRNRQTARSANPAPPTENKDAQPSDTASEAGPARGRTRKDTLTKEAPSTAQSTARSTRTVRAPVAPRSQATTKKKTVAFEEENKENCIEEIGPKRPASKDGKLVEHEDVVTKSSECAKKPASKTASSKRPGANVKVTAAAKKAHPDPLSPKKGYQTATPAVQNGRPGSAGLDSKTDTRPNSPVKKSLKIEAQPQGQEDGPHFEPATPSRTFGASITGSPPKRPPPSIQRDLKASSDRQGVSKSAESTGEALPGTDGSLLSQSPRKLGGLATTSSKFLPKPDAVETTQMMTQSPARRPPSPIKSLVHAGAPATPGHHATSLLQSPARRPPSTVKGLNFGSSKKGDALEGASISLTASRIQQKPLKFSMPPTQNPFASPDRLRQIAEASDADGLIDETTPNDVSASVAVAQAKAANHEDSNETVTSEPFGFQSPNVQWSSEVESEDELASDDPRYDASPARRQSTVASQADGSLVLTPRPASPIMEQTIPMTTLAERFGAWAGATPDDRVLKQRKEERSLFPVTSLHDPFIAPSPAKATPLPARSFDDAMEVHEDDDEDELTACIPGPVEESFRYSQASDASQEYGDENALPADPALQQPDGLGSAVCTPANVISKRQTLSTHTVSRVPLKPAGEDSHPALARTKPTRSQSLGGVLTPHREHDATAAAKMNAREVQTARPSRFTEDLTEKIDEWSVAGTPARTPRAKLDNKLLSGAVVFVDVHTSEGADASEIFVDLLSQMGAKCVKQWSWNPHSVEQDSMEGDQRVGITHVVFKDGGVRTMEKIREARGLVQCVGVGWVLDCERENKWMDEAEYSIDESTVPRGGHRRRKSMEPKMLSLLNGTLSATNSLRKLSGSVSPSTQGLSPSKEFLNLDSPQKGEDRRVSFAPLPASSLGTPHKRDESASYSAKAVDAFGTPPDKGLITIDGYENSPATPYFSYASNLVQQTCPPKQTQQLLFPLSGDIDEEPDESLRQKLFNARRKSLQYAPRVRSPLVKDR